MPKNGARSVITCYRMRLNTDTNSVIIGSLKTMVSLRLPFETPEVNFEKKCWSNSLLVSIVPKHPVRKKPVEQDLILAIARVPLNGGMMYAESENGPETASMAANLPEENQGSTLKQFKKNSNNQKKARMLSAGYFILKDTRVVTMEGT